MRLAARIVCGAFLLGIGILLLAFGVFSALDPNWRLYGLFYAALGSTVLFASVFFLRSRR